MTDAIDGENYDMYFHSGMGYGKQPPIRPAVFNFQSARPHGLEHDRVTEMDQYTNDKTQHWSVAPEKPLAGPSPLGNPHARPMEVLHQPWGIFSDAFPAYHHAEYQPDVLYEKGYNTKTGRQIEEDVRDQNWAQDIFEQVAGPDDDGGGANAAGGGPGPGPVPVARRGELPPPGSVGGPKRVAKGSTKSSRGPLAGVQSPDTRAHDLGGLASKTAPAAAAAASGPRHTVPMDVDDAMVQPISNLMKRGRSEPDLQTPKRRATAATPEVTPQVPQNKRRPRSSTASTSGEVYAPKRRLAEADDPMDIASEATPRKRGQRRPRSAPSPESTGAAAEPKRARPHGPVAGGGPRGPRRTGPFTSPPAAGGGPGPAAKAGALDLDNARPAAKKTNSEAQRYKDLRKRFWKHDLSLEEEEELWDMAVRFGYEDELKSEHGSAHSSRPNSGRASSARSLQSQSSKSGLTTPMSKSGSLRSSLTAPKSRDRTNWGQNPNVQRSLRGSARAQQLQRQEAYVQDNYEGDEVAEDLALDVPLQRPQRRRSAPQRDTSDLAQRFAEAQTALGDLLSNNGAGLEANVRKSQSKKAKHLRDVLRELNSHLPPSQRGKFNNGRYTTAGDVRRLLEEVREYL